jgi:hypothetical protein
MPESIAEARDAQGFLSALGREIASEGGSLTSLAESAGNHGDLADVEEKLLVKAQSLWLLAGKCAEWRTVESQRLDALAVRIADEIKESK